MSALTDVTNTPSSNLQAITKYQSLWRGYRVRRNYLSKQLCFLAKDFLFQVLDITDLPKASRGVTKVYLPLDLPVVFKALGIKRSENRFFTMWKARDLCKKNGYKHLLIPTAFPYKEYNIEEKFPVDEVKQKEQIGLYEENIELFTTAVKEFTGFLCQCIFPDILADLHPYQKETKIPLGRCDNLPLILDSDGGKIALIDLGGHRLRDQKLSLEEAIDCVKTALFIFPYHFDTIFKVVEMFFSEIIQKKVQLEELRDQVELRFGSIYKDHKAFVLEKIIGREGELPENRKCKLLKIAKLVILERAKNKDSFFSNQEIQALFLEKIMNPIVGRIVERADLDQSLISITCARSITLDCNLSFFVFQSKETFVEAQILLQLILDQFLTSKEVCYVNCYSNRFQNQFIRIHY